MLKAGHTAWHLIIIWNTHTLVMEHITWKPSSLSYHLKHTHLGDGTYYLEAKLIIIWNTHILVMEHITWKPSSSSSETHTHLDAQAEWWSTSPVSLSSSKKHTPAWSNWVMEHMHSTLFFPNYGTCAVSCFIIHTFFFKHCQGSFSLQNFA